MAHPPRSRLPVFGLLLALPALVVGCTSSSRPLSEADARLVFTVDTVRARGVLVPVPFEDKYVSASRSERYDGATVIRYRFDPPESEQFPFFFESAAAIYDIPGQANASGYAFELGLGISGVAPADRQPLEFPGLADEASIAYLHPEDGDDRVSGFLLSARTGNARFVLTMAGEPARDPSVWFPDVEERLRLLGVFTPSK